MERKDVDDGALLRRGKEHLKRGRLILSAIVLIIVVHWEFLIARAAESATPFELSLLMGYPLLLAALLIWSVFRD